MESTRVRVYFDIAKKGRGERAQALLKLMREQAESAKYSTFSLYENAAYGKNFYFHTTDAPNVVYYDLGSAKKLPDVLSVLKPLRVTLTGSHHFNFPLEGIYEDGSKVIWKSTWHNTDYDSEAPAIAENKWTVTIEATTIEDAYEQLRRIRAGEASLKYRWVNHFPMSKPQETGAIQTTDEDEFGDDPYKSTL